MWALEALALSLLGFASRATCFPQEHSTHVLTSRGIVTDGNIADKYDFVIVGGGLAGLVLASRLSEDPATTVLVLEAGDSGDEVKNFIDVPGYAYYHTQLKSPYDYNYNTTPQAKLNNRPLPWPRGKILGGSSAINGMYYVRPSDVELNAWSNLIAPDDKAAASVWGWDNMFATMKQGESFGPPNDAIKNKAGLRFDASKHGTNGPLHTSYPGYTFSQVADWSTTMENLGITPNDDPHSGNNIGSFVALSTINPTDWTRSYSRSAYIDPLPPRSNLAILTKATVTRVIFDEKSAPGNLVATGVEFAADRNGAKRTVRVGKEVILAGGAIGSPQVLMASGVGPRDVLESVGVKVLNELPGVGQHLQDHLATGINFKTNVSTAGGTFYSNSPDSQTPEFLSFVNSAVAFVNLTGLLGNHAAAFQQSVINAKESSASLVPSQDQEVLAGYHAISDIKANTFMSGQVGQTELLLSLNTANEIGVQAALQQPLSHGRLYINSASTFDQPVIDANYLAHPADLVIMRESLKLARKVAQTAPLNSVVGEEISPGAGVQTDEQWNAWLAGNVGTEFHPTSTCVMLPKNQGGVVNAKLQVYGLANVRVADSSVFPFPFSAHLMSSAYALAEQASIIIRAHNNGTAAGSSPGTPDRTTSLPSRKNAALSGPSLPVWTFVSTLVLVLFAL